jgi:hypothetical protein
MSTEQDQATFRIVVLTRKEQKQRGLVVPDENVDNELEWPSGVRDVTRIPRRLMNSFKKLVGVAIPEE